MEEIGKFGLEAPHPVVALPSDSFIGTGHIFVPVENEQVMHVYEMHHVMAHFPLALVAFFYDWDSH